MFVFIGIPGYFFVTLFDPENLFGVFGKHCPAFVITEIERHEALDLTRYRPHWIIRSEQYTVTAVFPDHAVNMLLIGKRKA